MTVTLHVGETVWRALQMGNQVPPPIIVCELKIFRQTSHDAETGYRYDWCDAYWVPHYNTVDVSGLSLQD